MPRPDYATVMPDQAMEDDCRQLVRLAVREDLDRSLDWTTVALIAGDAQGCCEVVPRQTGVCAGMVTVPWMIDEMDAAIEAEFLQTDRQTLIPDTPILRLQGNARDLLTTERVLLNVLSRLCGIATQTARFVAALGNTNAKLYDTRKTTPGWRRLEKYAVGCGGGRNHRTGLFDGFLIKDNHLALGGGNAAPMSPASAVEIAKRWAGGQADLAQAPEVVEVEVDSLEQLAEVLPAGPNIVLLDNFTVDELRRAVRMRNELARGVELEASGGVSLDTIVQIAATGVERISCGALTHQATWLDLGMDWKA